MSDSLNVDGELLPLATPVLNLGQMKRLATALGLEWNKAATLWYAMKPLMNGKASDLTGTDLRRLATAFNFDLSPSTAQTIVDKLPQFMANPDATVWEFVEKGGVQALLAGIPLSKPGDYIRRCPHCDGLLIPLLDR